MHAPAYRVTKTFASPFLQLKRKQKPKAHRARYYLRSLNIYISQHE